ncbi:MAG TPA: 50S ribosomal protein L1 [Euryarchaeota archaeon]|nr:50S ribosomal protein L1 [Euryarchaeota archaeon]HIQ10335.1 50S ribosomal protein L1 [Euryarchaeota archaeon]
MALADKEKFKKAIKEAKEKAKPRNFVETVEMAINFKNIDFKKPENRIEVQVTLPKGRGKPVKIGFFADKALAAELKKAGIVDKIITKEELMNMDKKSAKKLAKEFDFFLAEPSLMKDIARKVGAVLGPRKKMPRPVPPNIKAIEAMVKTLKNTVIVSNKKGKYLPVVHAPIGTVEMSEDDLAENAMAVYSAVLRKIPSEQNIRSVYVKTTMGPAVRVI